MRLESARLQLALLFVIVLSLLGFGLYLQHVKGLEPCPLCALQRYAFVLVALWALLGALHHPKTWGVKVYTALIGLTAISGAGVAIRHTYLQHFPPQFATCGPDLEYMVESLPLSRALPMIFKGSGDCSQVDWQLLGLSIAEWSLIWFTLIFIYALWRFTRKSNA